MVAPTLNEENPMTTEADKLMEDMRAVVEHAEALLHATSGQAGAGISEARARAEELDRGTPRAPRQQSGG